MSSKDSFGGQHHYFSSTTSTRKGQGQSSQMLTFPEKPHLGIVLHSFLRYYHFSAIPLLGELCPYMYYQLDGVALYFPFGTASFQLK